MRYIQNFDIICLIETFIDATFDLLNQFGDYLKYITPAVKLSYMGRRSGGLLLLIRKQLEPFVERISLPYDHIVGAKLSKELIKSNGDVILIGAYVPPKGSPFYRKMDSNCHISVLENCLLDISVQYPEHT